MGGQLVYTVGMIFMAIARNKVGVIIFSWTAGIMYSTLFTMPYLLVAHYHASQVVKNHTIQSLFIVERVIIRAVISIAVHMNSKGWRTALKLLWKCSESALFVSIKLILSC